MNEPEGFDIGARVWSGASGRHGVIVKDDESLSRVAGRVWVRFDGNDADTSVKTAVLHPVNPKPARSKGSPVVDPNDPRAALFSLTGLATHLHASCHAEAARLREIEAAAREWLTVPRRERYADQLDAAHQRLVDALADVLDLEAGLADVLDKMELAEGDGA